MANTETWALKTTVRRVARAVAPEASDGAPARRRRIAGERWLDTFSSAAQRICEASLTAVDPPLAIAQTIDETSAVLHLPRSTTAEALLDHALGDSRLASVSPSLAAQAHLSLVAGATGAHETLLWVMSETGRFVRVPTSGDLNDRWEKPEAVAELVTEPAEPFAVRRVGRDVAVRISRRGVCQGLLVVSAADRHQRESVERMALVTAKHLSVVFERWHLLEWNQAREEALLKAAEKRMVRLGYDLHDGPLQEIVSLGTEITLLRADVESLVQESARSAVADGFENLIERAAVLEQAMRGIAQSLETSALRREALDSLIRREIDAFELRTGIAGECDLEGDLSGLTESQRIALYRVVQEALTNVREHSHASCVCVQLRAETGGIKLTISDNGSGFDMTTELEAAAGRGRLGLVGIAERIRLLGGLFRVSSAPGQGTTLTLSLPRWSSIASLEDQGGPAASPYFS